MNTFFKLIEAKARRDAVRDLIVKAARAGDMSELNALLVADQQATGDFEHCVLAHHIAENQPQSTEGAAQ